MQDAIRNQLCDSWRTRSVAIQNQEEHAAYGKTIGAIVILEICPATSVARATRLTDRAVGVDQQESLELDRGLDQLASYMFWIMDQVEKGKILGEVDSVFGMLLAPNPTSATLDNLSAETNDHASQFDIDSNKIKIMGYSVKGTDISINPLT